MIIYLSLFFNVSIIVGLNNPVVYPSVSILILSVLPSGPLSCSSLKHHPLNHLSFHSANQFNFTHFPFTSVGSS